MAEENSTGNNLIWAVTMIIIAAIIGGAIYFLVLKTDVTPKKTEVDVEIRTPSR